MAVAVRHRSGEARLSSTVFSLAVVVLFAVSPSHGKRLNSIAGPWRSTIVDIRHCEGPNFHDRKFHTIILDVVGYYNNSAKHKKFKGSADYKKALEKGSMNVYFIVAKWDSVAGWKNNFFVMKMLDACGLIEGPAKNFWIDFSNNTTPHLPLRCPMPKGTYRLLDWDATFDTFTAFPIMQYGRFKGSLIFRDHSSQAATFCTEVIFDLLPREF